MPGAVSEITVETPGGVFSVPTPPDGWVPPSLDDPSGVHRIQVAVSSIRPFAWKGELLHANVHDDRWENLNGEQGVTISVPTNDPTVLALLCDDEETWGDRTTGRLSVLNRKFHTIEDGKVTGVYVPRSQAPISGGQVTFDCDGLTRLFDDRTLGRGQSNDLLNGAGHFPGEGSLSSLGFVWTGDPGDIDEIDGAREGRAFAIRGDALTDRLYVRKVIRVTETTDFHNLIRAAAFMRVPSDAVEGRSLMEIQIFRAGVGGTYFPPNGRANEGAAVIEDDTPSEDWSTNIITAVGRLPLGPYQVSVLAIVYPQSETEWTWVDELELFQRDNLSSGEPVDLVHHQRLLIEDAQDETRGKTTWNIPVQVGALCGVEEKLVVWREDEPTLPDALGAVSSRADGPDPVWIDAQGRARCEARRGTVRDDLTVGPDRIVRMDGWVVDPGSQVSQVRAQSDRGADYWAHSSIKTDLSQTEGMLIERVTRGPNGMGLAALDEFTQADLDQRAQAQETCTLWVSEPFGWTVNVGDTFQVVFWDGLLRFDRLVRVIQRSFHSRQRLVSLRVGTDDLDTGRPALKLDWRTQFGRDRHAIGDGLVATVGRTMRERLAPPPRYRPPLLGVISASSSDIDYGTSTTDEVSTIDFPDEGVYRVVVRHDVTTTGGTGTLGVYASADGFQATGRVETELTTAGVYTVRSEGILSSPGRYIHPTTGVVETIAAVDFDIHAELDLSGGSVTNRKSNWNVQRIG